jgi:hypothetical protein
MSFSACFRNVKLFQHRDWVKLKPVFPSTQSFIELECMIWLVPGIQLTSNNMIKTRAYYVGQRFFLDHHGMQANVSTLVCREHYCSYLQLLVWVLIFNALIFTVRKKTDMQNASLSLANAQDLRQSITRRGRQCATSGTFDFDDHLNLIKRRYDEIS